MMARELETYEPGGPTGLGYVAVDRTYGDLKAERWVFYYFDDARFLALDRYYKLSRPSKRHKWKIDDQYSRQARRGDFQLENPPPLPGWITEEALNTYVRMIRVGMWDDRYGKGQS